jgi:hypothetical protein
MREKSFVSVHVICSENTDNIRKWACGLYEGRGLQLASRENTLIYNKCRLRLNLPRDFLLTFHSDHAKSEAKSRQNNKNVFIFTRQQINANYESKDCSPHDD